MQTDSQTFKEGFLKTLKTAGYTDAQAEQLFKQANDPQGGGMALPPPPAAGHEGGESAELEQLEQLLQQLPPEVQEQVIQGIIAQLSGQGGGGAPGGAPGGHPGGGHQAPPPHGGGHQGPPQGGMPPQGGIPPQGMPKQGSANEDTLNIKRAEYIDSFVRRGVEYGLDGSTIKHIYKQALEYIEESQGTTKEAQEKLALHFNSFVERAAELGFSQNQAAKLYSRLR